MFTLSYTLNICIQGIICKEDTDYTQSHIKSDQPGSHDFSVNCQPIFMKFCNNHISTES